MSVNKTYHDLIIEACGRSVSPIERHALEKKIRDRLNKKYNDTTLTKENYNSELLYWKRNL
jgi:hypothetical protein|tara:strand:- start:427 stop:609 length:183 start_codon:yes stop_codon:yes gene_type:complete